MGEHAGQPASPFRFATTRWSLVLAAGGEPSPTAGGAAREAMEVLCRSYWYSLYAFVRRRGHGPEEAQDLTQAFFVRLLDKNVLASADPGRGRFRSFLLAAFKNFLTNEWARATAEKRGGGRATLPILADFDSAERQFGSGPGDSLTPERCFEREWAITLLANVLQELQQQFVASGRAALFDSLKPYLTADTHMATYAQVAQALNLSEGAVQVAVSRMRKRYRELLREHIAQTVESPDQVEDELRDLFRAVSGG